MTKERRNKYIDQLSGLDPETRGSWRSGEVTREYKNYKRLRVAPQEIHLDDPAYASHAEGDCNCADGFWQVGRESGLMRECAIIGYALLHFLGPAYLEEIFIRTQQDEDWVALGEPMHLGAGRFPALKVALGRLRNRYVLALAANAKGRGDQGIYFVPGHESRKRPWPRDTPPIVDSTN